MLFNIILTVSRSNLVFKVFSSKMCAGYKDDISESLNFNNFSTLLQYCIKQESCNDTREIFSRRVEGDEFRMMVFYTLVLHKNTQIIKYS